MSANDLTPPGFEAIVFENHIKKARKNIPFVVPAGNSFRYCVMFRTNDVASSTVWAQELPRYKRRARRRLIDHFFPEFFLFTSYNDGTSVAHIANDAGLTESEKDSLLEHHQNYLDLKEQIDDSVKIEKIIYRPGPPKDKVVFSTTLDLHQIREDLLYAEGGSGMPDFELSLTFLNKKLERGISTAATTIKFQNIPTHGGQLNDFLNIFGTFINQLQQGSGAPNMNDMQRSVEAIIKKITDSVYDTIDFQSHSQTMYDTDYFTVFFDGETQIVGIEFFVVGTEIGGSQSSKVGYITNIKYNPMFKDSALLHLLKNYREILESNLDNLNTAQQPSMIDFLERLGIPGAAGFGQALAGDPVFGAGLFGGDERPGTYVDVGGTASLESFLKDYANSVGMSEEDILKVDALASDPIFQAKKLQEQKARAVNTTVQVLDIINDVANFEVFHFMNQSPTGRKINRVLGSFGIQDLAKEVLICLTLGLGTTASRLTESMRNIILQQSVSFNAPPIPPSAQIDIKRPNLGLLFKDLKPEAYFSITGDPPLSKQIADHFLNTIAQAGFEVIKALAELLKFSCADVLDALHGVIDCGEEIKRRNIEASAAFPDLTTQLSEDAFSRGMTLEEAYEYFSEVSKILSPIEVCRLLNAPGQVTEETIENILEFNINYPLQAVQLNLDTRMKITSFFSAMTRNIDSVSFCNEIINDHIIAAVEGCQICLDTDVYQSTGVVDAVAGIAEHGVVIAAPAIPDFMCPERESYMANPIATRVIPRLMNNILETTKIYMGGSLESARNKLLVPVVVAEVDSEISGACRDANVDLPGANVDPAALQFITGLFSFLSSTDLATNFTDALTNCPDIPDAKFQSVVEDVQLVTDAIMAGMGEVQGVVAEAVTKINSVGQNLSSSGHAIPHTQYDFPLEFKADFENAVRPTVVTSQAGSYTGVPTISSSINDYEVQYNIITDQFKKTTFNFVFTPNSKATIIYDPYTPDASGPSIKFDYRVGLQHGSMGEDLVGTHTELVEDNRYELSSLNPYIYRYADAFPESDFPEPLKEIVGRDHPAIYQSLIQSMFQYIISNGAFDVSVLTNLQLFKSNANCAPENIGDLFDADGIINQMQKEFADSACNDRGGSSQDKIRGVLYFGLLNMLIQTMIDEFIVMNISAFTAINLDDLLNPKYPFRNIFVDRVVASFRLANTGTTTASNIMQRELYNYFYRASQRESVKQAGGFTHSYAPNEVVPGFETPGGEISQPGFPLNTDALVKFMVEERLGYTWYDGGTPRSTIRAIQNIINPGNTIKLFEDLFIEDVVGVYRDDGGGQGGRAYAFSKALPAGQTFSNRSARETLTNFHQNIWGLFLSGHDAPTQTVYIIDERAPLNVAGELVIYHGSLDVGTTTGLTETPLATLPYTGNPSRDEKIALIKEWPEFNLLFAQAFNRHTILMVPILYNLFLTKKYFGDISLSFNTTKRAIIEMFKITGASSSLPPLPIRSELFTDGLADNGTDFGTMARDIFLKFLKETPLKILKGLAELIDPHVAISKIIRDVTGATFNEIIKGIQSQIDDGLLPGAAQLKEKGITAEDILAVVFCIYNTGMTIPAAFASTPGQDSMLFGPRITLDGMDFTGSVAGMLMAPPSPLGIAYLLLELLKISLDEALDTGEEGVESATAPDSIACPEGTVAANTGNTETE